MNRIEAIQAAVERVGVERWLDLPHEERQRLIAEALGRAPKAETLEIEGVSE